MFAEEIGCGTYGSVFLQESGNEVVKRQIYDETCAAKEAYVLSRLNHPSILPITQTFKTGEHLIIRMPHVDKFDYIPSEDLPLFIESLLEVVRYLHVQNIYHRDICDVNILYDRDLRKPYLIDFGTVTCKKFSMMNYCHLNFTSPEALLEDNEVNSEALDIWSLGILFLTQISDYNDLCVPMEDNEFLYYYYKGKFGFGLDKSGVFFDNERYKPLVQDMLQFDPKNRLTIEQLLNKYFPEHRIHVHKALFDEKVIQGLDMNDSVPGDDELMTLDEIYLNYVKIEEVNVEKTIDCSYSYSKLSHLVKCANSIDETKEILYYFINLLKATKENNKKIGIIIEFFGKISNKSLKFFTSKSHEFFQLLINKCDEFGRQAVIHKLMKKYKKKITRTLHKRNMHKTYSNITSYYLCLRNGR